MKREEAIDLLDNLKGMIEDSQGNDYDEAFRMAINALKQEPSTDAVSRQMIEEIKEIMTDISGNSVYVARMSDIRALPPVTPTSPKGHWIQKEGIYGVSFCDRCDFELTINDTNFCPNCGQDMRGEE